MKLPVMFEKDAKLAAFTAGETIFEAGQDADFMYIVKEGEIEVVIRDRVVETVGPEGFFGEMALIDSQPRSAKVVAKTDCALYALDQKQFTFMIQETPFTALEVMRVMAARLRQQNTEA